MTLTTIVFIVELVYCQATLLKDLNPERKEGRRRDNMDKTKCEIHSFSKKKIARKYGFKYISI